MPRHYWRKTTRGSIISTLKEKAESMQVLEIPCDHLPRGFLLLQVIHGFASLKSGTISLRLHQSTAASTWWCSPRHRLGWVEMAVGLPKGPSYFGHSPLFFCYAAP